MANGNKIKAENILMGLSLVVFLLFCGCTSNKDSTSNNVGNPINLDPKGVMDGINCDQISGWACDPNDYTKQLEVYFYLDGPANVGKFIGSYTANQPRENAVAAECGGYANHGFIFLTPDALKDGAQHMVYAYAVNVPAGDNLKLSASTNVVQCVKKETTSSTIPERSTPPITLPSLSENKADSNIGQVLHLKFDENKGSVVLDSSDYGNNGIIHDAKWIPGKFGSALQFNGVDSYVQIPDSPSLHLTDDMTIELWTMPGTLQVEWADILSKHATNVGGIALEQKYRETNAYTFAWSTDGINWACGSITDSVSLTPNVWQHIAVSKSGLTLTYYLNGKEEAYCRGNFAQTSKNNLDLTIGKWSTGARYYNGIIDEIRIYDRALSGEEIKAQYLSESGRYL